jgi:O-antigen/teichoic acid export membrane protein
VISLIVGLRAYCSAVYSSLRNRGEIAALWQGCWVLGDQAVVSMANFLTAVVIGRNCLPREFGLYDLMFTALMLYQGIPKALIWTPYTSGAAHRRSVSLARYTGSATIHLIGISLIGALILLAGAGLFFLIPDGAEMGRMLLLLAPIVGLFLLREHVRRIALARLKIGEAVMIDTAVSVVQVGSVMWLAHAAMLNAWTAIISIAAAQCVAGLWFFTWQRRHEVILRVSDALTDGADHWSFSRWLLPGAVLTLLCETMYRWFLPITHGLDSLAIFAASMSLIRIFNPLIIGLANWGNPFAAKTYAHDGLDGLYRVTRMATLALLALILFCLPVFIIWGGGIVEFMFGGKYQNTGPIVTALAFSMLAQALLLPVDSALLALRQGRFLLVVVAVRLAVTCSIGLALTWRFGPVGAAYGVFLASATVLVLDWIYFNKLVRDGDERAIIVADTPAGPLGCEA